MQKYMLKWTVVLMVALIAVGVGVYCSPLSQRGLELSILWLT